MPQKKSYTIFNNSRFYVLVSTFVLSILIVSLLRLQIPSDQLLSIRSQQVFGLLSIIYWYIALIISPMGYIIGKQRMKYAEFARRAIGVSAFYFAVLHSGIALWGQLGGFGELQYLPSLFQWSLLGGVFALVILGVMAATSFDRVVKFMTYRKWKWLHRLVYSAGIVIILHIWSIGTHLAYTNIQIAAFIMLAILSGLEFYRISKKLSDTYFHLNKSEVFVMFLAAWTCVLILIFLIPSFIQNYHGQHTGHDKTSSGMDMKM